MSFTRTLRAVGGAVVAGALLFGTAPVASADSIRESQWPLTAFDAEQVWEQSTGKGVTVAVIDHAVDGTHPDLSGSVLPGKSFVTGGTANRNEPGSDEDDHGTAMASLIAGHGHGSGDSEGVKGLAPDAKILPVEINIDTSTGGGTEWAEALRYAVDQGASVVNMSFDHGIVYTDEEKQAVAYAAEKDVLLVGGAGNTGASRVSFPAAAPGVIGVGAVDKNGVVWEDSNYGSALMLTAPGVYIRSASNGGGYHLADGTSDATAYVSATAALLRSKYPDLTAGQIANRLVKTAGLPSSESGLSLPDKHYGYGFIRPYHALVDDIPAGSKQGPLKSTGADSSASGSPSAAATSGGSDAANSSASSDSSGLGIGVLVAIGAAVLVIVVILLIVLSKRGGRRNGPGSGPMPPPGGGWQQQPPTGYPPHPGQAPGPNPYQQQNPYASQQQPPNQWPNQ
ncbi:S8 family serine peptidase [Streptomyces sp. NBC_01262]|uniref:S8 family serine peptidase n=1 Tax=Streptomyces sp. NBC_01262 TaxID=2903803 RepID=UPI002E2F78BC|nr:S8 family serine peptidase [Streptomyces sp. NBC_01262]